MVNPSRRRGRIEPAKLALAAIAVAGLALLGKLNPSPADSGPKDPEPNVASAQAGPSGHGQSAPDRGPRKPSYVTEPDAAARYVSNLAKQSGGDYNRLNREDQAYLDHVTQRHGPQMLRMIADKTRPRRAAR